MGILIFVGVVNCKGGGVANYGGVWLTLRVEAFSLMTVPVFLKAVDVFSPRAFTLSFSLERGGGGGGERE